MRKIAAFFTALIIFLLILSKIQVTPEKNEKMPDLAFNNKEFGTWINSTKDSSYNSVSVNIHRDTMLVLGSSEFNHGLHTPYHPAQLFKDQNIDLMMIGGASSQSLYHSIILGAEEPKLKNRKVVLFLSPSWFYHYGIKPDAYASKFSESNYIAFMENKHISKEIKQYVSQRNEQLLASQPEILKNVRIYNDIFVNDDATVAETTYLKTRKSFLYDIEKNKILEESSAAGIVKKKKLDAYNDHAVKLDWNALSAKAVSESKIETTNNPFYMIDSRFTEITKGDLNHIRNSRAKNAFDSSPEYQDLEIFLQLCKEQKIEPLIILQSMNGYFYDYAGFGNEKRVVLENKLKELSSKYKFEMADFYDNTYTPYFLEDNVHPGREGWVKINEKIYNFYKKN